MHEGEPRATARGFEHVETTTCSVRALWACWTDVSTWSHWAAWVASATLQGPFQPGTRGLVTDQYGFRTTFTIIEIDPRRSQEFAVHLFGARVHMRREIVSESTVTTYKHGVHIEGPLWWVYARPLKRWKQELPESMRNLARYAASM